MSSLYLIEGPTGCYVGITKQAATKRWKQHQWYARQPRRTSHLYHAIRKHGIDNFHFTVIQHFDSYEACAFAEADWIARLNEIGTPLYNTVLSDTAERTVSSTYAQQRIDTLELHRQITTNLWKDPEFRERTSRSIGEAQRARAEDIARKMSEVMADPKHSDWYQRFRTACLSETTKEKRRATKSSPEFRARLSEAIKAGKRRKKELEKNG